MHAGIYMGRYVQVQMEGSPGYAQPGLEYPLATLEVRHVVSWIWMRPEVEKISILI